MKDLLQHHQSRIAPTIHRIVWLYKRWQPLYTVIQETVTPRVEFNQGIPQDLDDDDFFDPRMNNLLILDDLFAESDKRITGLYTEGSHHRSLSVIGINQNLFGTKDPTQRRNSHYLVLFKTPVDSQAVMTLAKQMYPGKSDMFMSIFAKATKAPYGYILVDLKPFTSEKERLHYKVTWPDQVQMETKGTNQKPESYSSAIKEDTPLIQNHSTVGVQIVNTDSETTMADKTNACDDCGLLFDTAHDVQRHVKRGWCSEGTQEPPQKKQKSEEPMEDDVEENQAFLNLWQKAQNENSDRWNKFYDRFVSEGETEEESENLADERIQSYYERDFFQQYARLIEAYIVPLKHSVLHQQIMKDMEHLTTQGISVQSAVKRVLKKNASRFEHLFDIEFSDDESDIDEGGDDEENDSE